MTRRAAVGLLVRGWRGGRCRDSRQEGAERGVRHGAAGRAPSGVQGMALRAVVGLLVGAGVRASRGRRPGGVRPGAAAEGDRDNAGDALACTPNATAVKPSS